MEREEPFCRTVSLRKVHFLEPRPDEIDIRDIAFHLAKIGRFNGGIRLGHYSVAEHSILMSLELDDIKDKKYALLHDAAEYIFGDLQAPIKRMCPDYNMLIDTFQRYIFAKFGVNHLMPSYIDTLDKRICSSEMVQLRGQDFVPGIKEPPLNNPVAFQLFTPEQAEESFLFHFAQYWGNDAEQYLLGDAAP